MVVLLVLELLGQERRGERPVNVASVDFRPMILVIGLVGHVRIGKHADPNVRLLLKHRIRISVVRIVVAVVIVVQIGSLVRLLHRLWPVPVVPVIPAIQDGFDSKKDGQEQFRANHGPVLRAALLDDRFQRHDGFFHCKGS